MKNSFTDSDICQGPDTETRLCNFDAYHSMYYMYIDGENDKNNILYELLIILRCTDIQTIQSTTDDYIK